MLGVAGGVGQEKDLLRRACLFMPLSITGRPGINFGVSGFGVSKPEYSFTEIIITNRNIIKFILRLSSTIYFLTSYFCRNIFWFSIFNSSSLYRAFKRVFYILL
jgi:hypothetical protein